MSKMFDKDRLEEEWQGLRESGVLDNYTLLDTVLKRVFDDEERHEGRTEGHWDSDQEMLSLLQARVKELRDSSVPAEGDQYSLDRVEAKDDASVSANLIPKSLDKESKDTAGIERVCDKLSEIADEIVEIPRDSISEGIRSRLLDTLAGIIAHILGSTRGRLVSIPTPEPGRGDRARRRKRKDSSVAIPHPAEEKYPGGRGDAPVEFLREHYGQYLRHFGASHDVMSQADLRHFDKKLFEAVRNRLEYLRRQAGGDGLTISDVVPTKSDLLSQRISAATLEELKDDPQLSGAVYSRAKRAKRD